MATVKRTGLPEFWVTGLAKILVGEQPCRLEAWMKGHYRVDKVERDRAGLTQYKIDHTERLRDEAERYKADGWKVDQERYIRVTGQTAILIGKADLVARKAGSRPRIVDCKRTARDSDVAQVAIYMAVLPLSWHAPGMIFDGEVAYANGERTKVTPPEAEAIKPKLFALLRELGTDERPEPVPGATNCRWCDLSTADCAARFTESVDVLTSEF